jgi:hypothetical protein
MASTCEDGNENLGFIKGSEFLGQLSDYELFKEYSAVWS